MNDCRAVGLVEGSEEGSEEEIREAWQHLVDTGLRWRLRGWFGRTAKELIELGVIREKETGKEAGND